MTVKSSWVAAVLAAAALAGHEAQSGFAAAAPTTDVHDAHGVVSDQAATDAIAPPISAGVEEPHHADDDDDDYDDGDYGHHHQHHADDDDDDDEDDEDVDDEEAMREFAEMLKQQGGAESDHDESQKSLDQLMNNPEFANAFGGDSQHHHHQEQHQQRVAAAEALQKRREQETAEIRKKAAERFAQLKPMQYSTPKASPDVHFLEPFGDGDDINAHWVPAGDEKYGAGQFLVKTRAEPEGIIGDAGLRVMSSNQFHGIARSLDTNEFTSNEGKELALSYEVRFEERLECGGGYLKLFSTQQPERVVDKEEAEASSAAGSSATIPAREITLSEFGSNTLYSVMFGPDRCGATSKVHFIIQERNPVTGKWVEHHLVDPPAVPSDMLTHQYGFVISPDDTFEVLIDALVVRSGSLHEEFSPSFTPDKEITDPEDKFPPEDYEHNPRIPDPDVVKPEDWDEEAPAMIPDPSATMPDDWLPNEPRTIPDPTSSKPAEWDDDEDGEWFAPRIANPACRGASGCGEWVAPLVPNPKYKGQWTAPLIANPKYTGPWTPRKIPNPHYYESKHPHAVAPFNAVGIEIWTVQPGALFDNIALGRSKPAVMELINETWAVRSKLEREFARIMDETARQLESEKQAATMETFSFVQRSLLKAVEIAQLVTNTFADFSTDHPVAALLATTAIGLLTLFGVARLFRRPRRRSPQATTTPDASGKSSAADAATDASATTTASSDAASPADADAAAVGTTANSSSDGKNKSAVDETSSSDKATATTKTAAGGTARSRKPAVE